MAFNRDPSLVFRRFENITEVEPNSGSVNIFATLRKYVKEFGELHLLDSHISQVFLHLAKTFLPNNYASLSRFGGDATAFFEALLSLGDTENETMKIRNSLDSLKRSPGEPVSSILLKI